MSGRAEVDLLIIGGGVNGAGIARDAAGRGLRVLLCEQGDLAGATSSASSKLVHGGLRYLEHRQFRLVRESLREREILMAIAPHLVRPMKFVLPYEAGLRPRWLIRLGLLLYDGMAARRRLAASRGIDLRAGPAGAPLQPRLRAGFSYSDCRVDDSRLVALNALDAAERGAGVRTRTRCVAARRERDRWRVALRHVASGRETLVEARVLVNAAGPWADEVARLCRGPQTRRRLRLLRGSHIVTPRLYDGEHAYILQNDDGRVVFVIPYETSFTLIGTTEVPFEGDPARAAIEADEIAYLCRAVSRCFTSAVTPSDVAFSFSGVRALCDRDATRASGASRDYDLDWDAREDAAPLLGVFGGKFTTYRRLAERAVDLVCGRLAPPRPNPWTAGAPLPGGELPGGDPDRAAAALLARRDWLPAPLARRLCAAYGARAEAVLGSARALADLGEPYGAGLYEAEVDYLVRREFVFCAEDLLWRRSKLGLHMTPAQRARVEARLGAQAGGEAGAIQDP